MDTLNAEWNENLKSLSKKKKNENLKCFVEWLKQSWRLNSVMIKEVKCLVKSLSKKKKCLVKKQLKTKNK